MHFDGNTLENTKCNTWKRKKKNTDTAVELSNSRKEVAQIHTRMQHSKRTNELILSIGTARRTQKHFSNSLSERISELTQFRLLLLIISMKSICEFMRFFESLPFLLQQKYLFRVYNLKRMNLKKLKRQWHLAKMLNVNTCFTYMLFIRLKPYKTRQTLFSWNDYVEANKITNKVHLT